MQSVLSVVEFLWLRPGRAGLFLVFCGRFIIGCRFTAPSANPSGQGPAKPTHQPRHIPQVMFPNSHHPPPLRPKRAIHLPIPCPIPVQLPLPEAPVMPGLRPMLWATVPETPVHKNRHPLLAKREIRLAKQSHLAPPSGDVMPPQHLRQRPLRLPVSRRPDSPHHLRPFRFGEDVRHRRLLLQHCV